MIQTVKGGGSSGRQRQRKKLVMADCIVTCSLNSYFPWHVSKFLFQEKYLVF